METKNIKRINFTKMLTLVLTIFVFITMILHAIVLYQPYSESEGSVVVLFIIISGIVWGLIVRVGLTLLFWGSYNIKYPNEKFNERIGKKVIAYFLFMMAIAGLSLNQGMLLISIICTLLIAIREQEKPEVE